MAPPAWHVLRSHAAVSLPVFGLTAAFLIVMAVPLAVPLHLPANLLLLNGVVMFAIVGVVLLGGNRIAHVWYRDALLPRGMVLAIAVLIAAATEVPLLIEGVVGAAGLTAGHVFSEVVVPRSLMAGVYLLAVYLVGIRRWYTDERARAQGDLVDARAASLAASGALAATMSAVVEDARHLSSGPRMSADELLATAMQSSDPAVSARAAQALRDTARVSVRAASHRLWQRSVGSPERMPWREILVVSVRERPLPMIGAALVVAFYSLTKSGGLMGVRPPGGLVTALVGLAWLLAVFGVGRLAIRRWPGPALIITVVAALLVVVGPLTVTPWAVSPAVLAWASGPVGLWRVLVLVVITVASSVALTARDAAGTVIAGLEDARREAEVDRRVLAEATARLQREVAQHVHGTVQPGLIAASLAIDEAVARNDHAALMHALATARVALDADFTPQPATVGMSLAQVADALRTQWSGLLDVRYQGVLPAVAPEAVEAFKDVVQECLNNAYIHGGARHAVVNVVTETDGSAVVHISDDGSGPGSGPPGLGSAIMTHATHGEWSMCPADGGGSLVRAVIR